MLWIVLKTFWNFLNAHSLVLVDIRVVTTWKILGERVLRMQEGCNHIKGRHQQDNKTGIKESGSFVLFPPTLLVHEHLRACALAVLELTPSRSMPLSPLCWVTVFPKLVFLHSVQLFQCKDGQPRQDEGKHFCLVGEGLCWGLSSGSLGIFELFEFHRAQMAPALHQVCPALCFSV